MHVTIITIQALSPLIWVSYAFHTHPTNPENFIDDFDHLKDHLRGQINEVDISKLTSQEAELYYFIVHDIDMNDKLDGLELIEALFHSHDNEQHQADEHDDKYVPAVNLQDIEVRVDNLLRRMDLDNDGYLTFPEIVGKRKRSQRVADDL